MELDVFEDITFTNRVGAVDDAIFITEDHKFLCGQIVRGEEDEEWLIPDNAPLFDTFESAKQWALS